MKLKLTESQFQKLTSLVSEMAYPATFDMSVFKSLNSFQSRIEYCASRLKRLGAGSSRIVYQIDDEKCLKLAKNQKGVAQNLAEIEFGTSYDSNYFDITPKIFDYSEGGEFVEMELCMPADSALFKQKYGVPIEALFEMIDEEMSNWQRIYYFQYYDFENTVHKVWQGTYGDETMQFFNSVREFVASGPCHYGDLKRIQNWGINNHGEFRLIDFGGTKDVMSRYYRC